MRSFSFLQDIDIFKYTQSEGLALIAAISEEITVENGNILFREGDISDSMYMVIDGKVRLDREGKIVMIASHKDVFGTWALFDDEPRVATATTIEDSRILKIDKEDFIDLLADNVQLTQGILKTMVKRLRGLMQPLGL